MDIGVIGWWHYDNQGDLAMLDSLTRALAPHRIVPIDTHFPLNEAELQRLNRLDYVILGGGTQFQTAPVPPFDTFDTWEQRLQTPIGVVGLGVDSLPAQYRSAVNELVERSHFFTVRDRASQEIIDHPKVQLAPDLTFLNPLTTSTRQAQAVCGVNLRMSPGFPIDQWRQALRSLPIELRGVPFSTFGGWQEQQLLQELDQACPATFSADLYQQLDFFIGTAFHSIVFAVQAAIPVIAIAYAPKVRRFMADIGLPDYVLEFDEWPRLPAMFAAIMKERDRLARQLRETTAALQQSAQQAMADVVAEIDRSGKARARTGPTVSIVVVGGQATAANQLSVESALDQTYENIEVLLVAREPETALLNMPQSPRLRFVPSADGNLAACLNRAFAQATGEYRTWIAAGDSFTRDAIDCLVDYLQREPACDLVFADYYRLGDQSCITDVHSVHAADKLFRRNVIGPCVLYRSRLGEALGGFDAHSPDAAYAYWLSANKSGRLTPFHARLFYTRMDYDAEYKRSSERTVRRQWRSKMAWPHRAAWRVIDTDFVDRYAIRPVMSLLRRSRAAVRRIDARQGIQRSTRALRTVLLKNDVGRWRQVAKKTPGWDDRTKIIASFIPGRSSVLDLGAGAQTLKRYLKPGCEYQPCDIVKSSADVLLCDFNSGLYPAVKKRYDFVVCSGVFEYMRHPQEFLATISTLGEELLMSYAPRRDGESKIARLGEGWNNHITASEFEGLLGTCGLTWTIVGQWNQHMLYRIRPSKPLALEAAPALGNSASTTAP